MQVRICSAIYIEILITIIFFYGPNKSQQRAWNCMRKYYRKKVHRFFRISTHITRSSHSTKYTFINIYLKYYVNWLKICLKTVSGVSYLHSGSILFNCAIVDIFLGLHFCKVLLMHKNVNW